MTYTLEELVKSFQKVARIREGYKEYANDAGYWEGGRCEWGGSHNLREDCQTLINAFSKIENLGEIKKELEQCTSESEYNSKKQNYIRKCDETLSSLQIRTGKASSMFGICIIWADEATNKTVESKVKVVREDLQKIKKSLEKESYKWVQELKELNLEIRKIEQRMEDNKRKAMKETDPIKKATLIQAIEDDGELLQKKYEKKKEISGKFKFDPAKKVKDLVEEMKKAIKNRKNKDKSPNDDEENSDTENSDSNNDSDDEENSDNSPNSQRKRSGNTPQNFFQKNQQLILIAGILLLALFYFYSQKQEKESNYYDF